MVRPQRKKFAFDSHLVSKEDGLQFLRKGASLMVREATKKVYNGRVDKYRSYLRRTGETESLLSFSGFLANLFRQGAAGTTLAGYRAAVLYAQKVELSEQWADDKRLINACKGFAYSYRLSAPQRGVINVTMLRQLQSLDLLYKIPFGLLFFGVLRVSELERMRVGDLVTSEEGTQLWVRKDKRVTALRSFQQEGHWKEIVSREFIEYVEALSNQAKHGSPLFAWVKRDKMLQLVELAAGVFSWPVDVIYDGVHCLRHGGANYLQTSLQATNSLVQKAAVMSEGTRKFYSRANRLRQT